MSFKALFRLSKGISLAEGGGGIMLTSFHINGEGGIAEQQTNSVNGEGGVVLGIFHHV